jgi:hypothetical protein
MSSFFFEGLHIIEKLEIIVDIFEGLKKVLRAARKGSNEMNDTHDGFVWPTIQR